MPELDEQLRSYAAWLADRADAEAAGRAAAPTALVHGTQPRRGGWVLGAAAAAVAAVLVAGLVLLTGSPDDDIPVPPATEPTTPVASSPIDDVDVGGGMIVPVIGDAVTIDGVRVHQGAGSTEDVSELLASLGGEPVDLSLEPVAASAFPMPADYTDPPPDAVAVIGARDDVAVAVHGRREAVGDVRCAVLASLSDDDWGGVCSGGPIMSITGPIGTWVLWADLPEDTAVVVVVDADDRPVAYQQPTGRAVAFTGWPSRGAVMRAYDASGRVLDEQDRVHGSTADTSTSNTSTSSSLPVTIAPPTGSHTLPEAPRAPRHGEEIGFGSTGPPIDVPQPWPMSTIYTDLEPQALFVDFVPPNQDCIAAQANATIGRAGAILVSLWVEGNRTDGPCPQSAETNRVRVPLAEPIGDRRIYTSTVPDTRGASERAELVADSIIDLPADEAVEIIRREGFEVRDLTDAEEADADFAPDRINIWRVDGVIDFAAVG